MRLHLDTIHTSNPNAWVSPDGLVFVNFGTLAGGTYLCGTVEEAEKMHSVIGQAIAEARAKQSLANSIPAGAIPC